MNVPLGTEAGPRLEPESSTSHGVIPKAPSKPARGEAALSYWFVGMCWNAKWLQVHMGSEYSRGWRVASLSRS